MQVKDRVQHQKLSGSNTATRRWLVVCACVAVLLAIAVACVTVLHVMSLDTHRSQSDALNQQIAALESQVSSLESQQAEDSSRIDAQQSTINDQEQQLKDKDEQLKEKDKEIQEKDEEIENQQETIDDLTAQIAAKNPTKSTSTGKTTVPHSLSTSDKLIALTFDDGPGPYTERLLDAMKERGVRATFFLLGSRVNSYKSLIKRMEKEGHVVGNHSQSHPNLATLSAANIKKDMNSCAEKINKILGHYPTVMRAPYGSLNSNVKKYAKNADVAIIQWSVDTRDWESRNVNAIMKESFQGGYYGIQDGAIVLMHDIYSTTVDAAIKMMDRLKKEGYTMVTVPELLSVREGGMQAGTVYTDGIKG